MRTECARLPAMLLAACFRCEYRGLCYASGLLRVISNGWSLVQIILLIKMQSVVKHVIVRSIELTFQLACA